MKEVEVVKETKMVNKEAKIQDIEDTIADATIEKKKMDLVLDKTRYFNYFTVTVTLCLDLIVVL